MSRSSKITLIQYRSYRNYLKMEQNCGKDLSKATKKKTNEEVHNA